MPERKRKHEKPTADKRSAPKAKLDSPWVALVRPLEAPDLHREFTKELVFFGKTYELKTTPLVAGQAALAFASPIILGALLFSILFPAAAIPEFQFVKNTETRQLTAAVAAPAQSKRQEAVRWSIMVKKSDISAGNPYVKLPKGAKKISVKSVSKERANEVMAMVTPKPELSMERRVALAQGTSFLARLQGFLFASVQDALEGDGNDGDVAVVETEDGLAVDLSEYAEEEPEEEAVDEVVSPSDGELVVEEDPEPIAPAAETVSPADGGILVEEEPSDETVSPSDDEVVIEDGIEEEPADEEYVEVTYETEAPGIESRATDKGKLVTVADESHARDVLAFTTIPEIYRVGQEHKIKLVWKSEDNQPVQFDAYDTNGNGKLDYVEWTVPHLSEQVFELIFISKAFELDENLEIIDDIYDLVHDDEGEFATVAQGHTVRFAFEIEVDRTKDITLVAKPTHEGTPVSVEVYPLYEDEEGNYNAGPLIATFNNISELGTYKVLLGNLETKTKDFDLKIIGGDVDMDIIIDPSYSLVGYWKLDAGSGNPADSSGYGYTGTLGGSPSYSSSVKPTLTFSNPYALTLNGTSQYFTLTAEPFYAASATTFTVSLWSNIQQSDLGGTFHCAYESMRGSFSTGAGMQIMFDGRTNPGGLTGTNFIMVQMVTSGGNRGASSSSGSLPTDGNWHHYVITHDGSATAFYKDGVSMGSQVSSTNNKTGNYIPVNNTAAIGRLAHTSGGFLPGSIDDVRMYSRVLSANEITALAAGNHTSATWDGSSSTTYATAANWDTNALPDPYTNVVIADVDNDPIMSASESMASLTIDSGGVLDIGGNSLTINDSGAFANNGTFKLQGGETLTGFTNDTDSGTIIYTGTSSYTGLKAGNTYNNLTFNGSGGAWTLNNLLTVNGNLTNTAGTLNTSGSNYGISVGGNWLNNGGTFTANSSTVTLTGTGGSGQITSGGQSFYALTQNGSGGTYTLQDALTCSNNLTITAGTLDVNSSSNYGVTVGGNWSNSGTFTARNGTVTLNGSNQTISGTTTFYNLTKNVTSAATLTFPASATQTIAGTCTLTGQSGQLLSLRSSSTDTQWIFDPQGTRTFSYLDVKDSNNANATAISTFGNNITNSGNNTNWTFNTAPSVTAGPSDGSSSTTTPTNAGSNVTFTATATDADSDSYYLAICKTDAVTPANNSAPTCGGGSWAISSSTASGAQASVTYAALVGDAESNAWYAFVCDHNAASACSSSSQGSGDAGSPFAVNHRPSFSSVSATAGYVRAGQTITVTTTSSDADSSGSADTVSVYACKANDFTGSACGAGGTWCSATGAASNASCGYTVQAEDGDNTYTYYAFVVDNHGFASTDNPRSGTFSTDTTAPTTSDDYADDGEWVTSEQTITLTPNCDASGCASTKYCTDSSNACIVSSGTNYTAPVVISDSGTTYFRYASTDNAGNVQDTVSLEVKIDTADPETTATAANGYVFGDWSTVNVSVSLSCDDGDGSGCASVKYCTDGSNACTPASTYSSAIAITNDGTTYVRYFATDEAGNEEAVGSVTVKVDKTNPSVNAGSDQTKNAQFTQDATASDPASGIASYQWSKQSGPGNITFGTDDEEDTTVTADADGFYIIRLTVTDNAGNSDYADFGLTWDTAAPVLAEIQGIGTSSSPTPSYTFSSSEAGGISYGGACSSATTEAVSGNNTVAFAALANGFHSNCTVTVTDEAGNVSEALAVTQFHVETVPAAAGGSSYANIAVNPITIIREITKPIIEIFTPPAQPVPPPPAVTPEQVAPELPRETPPAFQLPNVGSIVAKGPIIGISPIALNVNFFANRVAQFSQTLLQTGINAANPGDVKRLAGVDLVIPGLTQTALKNAGLSVTQLSSTGIPLAQLSAKVKEQIPNNMVFARTAGELVDYPINLSFNEQGTAQASVRTLTGKPVQLVVRPDKLAKKVDGLLLVKSIGEEENANPVAWLSSRLTAAVSGGSVPAQEGRLLIERFSYQRAETGLWKAEIVAPLVEGEYDIITLIEYSDPTEVTKITTLTMVVDPEGYVYRQLKEGRLRIGKATVSIYWQNPETSEFILWPAEEFLQQNPQITNETGRYSFLVPPGIYYMTVSAPGYADYRTENFPVVYDNGVHMDIEMQKRNFLQEWWGGFTQWISSLWKK